MENDKKELQEGSTETLSDSSAYLGWFVMLSHKYDSHAEGLYPNISKDDWIKKIENRMEEISKHNDVQNLMYIFHEPETDENSQSMDGEKGFHCHAVVRFKSGDKKTVSSSKRKDYVVDIFKASDRAKNVTNIDSYLAVYRYMTHVSDQAIEDEKTPYPFTDVKVLGEFVYNRPLIDPKSKEVLGAVTEKVTGQRAYRVAIKKTTWLENTKLVSKDTAKLIELELADKVYRGKIRHVTALKEFTEKAGYAYARDSKFELDAENRVKVVYDKMVENKTRTLRNIYITGEGGVGKTFLANELAEYYAEGLGVYIGSPTGKRKTPDVMNHLRDEKSVVLNEVGSEMFSVDEFNNSFDPNNMSPFSSRNENKPFIGDTIVMTQSIPHSRFSKRLMIYDQGGSKYSDPTNKTELNQLKDTQDKYWQVIRRIRNNIILLRDENNPELIWANVFNLDEELKDHIFVGRFSFDNSFGKAPSLSPDQLQKAVELMDFNTADIEEKNIKLIGDFNDEHNLDVIVEDDLFSRFMADMEPKFTWDLIPTAFLLDLFNAWLKKFEPSEPLWGLSGLSSRLKRYVETVTTWEYKDVAVGAKKRMTKPEYLIQEYYLTNWMTNSGSGNASRCTPEFDEKKNGNQFKNRYRGLVRIKKDLLD